MDIATGGFATAALKFAVGQARDSRSRTKLAAAYEGAAELVVNHYETASTNFAAGAPAWNAIVDLLRTEACGEALSLDGTLNEESLRPLRYWYTQDEPPLLDILSRMIDEIAKIAGETLRQDDRTVVNLLTVKANEARALLREQAGKLDHIGDRLEDVYKAVSGGAVAGEPAPPREPSPRTRTTASSGQSSTSSGNASAPSRSSASAAPSAWAARAALVRACWRSTTPGRTSRAACCTAPSTRARPDLVL